MEQNNMPENTGSSQQTEIDLLELVRKVWVERRLIIKWCVAAAIVGLVVAFSIPREYTVSVKLAPESSGDKTSMGGLASLASIAGINMGGMSSSDALSPDIYPDIVTSVPFMTELFGVKVVTDKESQPTTVYAYMTDDIRSAWWGAVVAFPFKVLGWVRSLFSAGEEPSSQAGVDPFRLTRDEDAVVKALRQRIEVSIDKKTMVVSLSVTMQDPLIAATLTDTVMRNLQDYITEYRTNKARHDQVFTQKLFDEAQSNYYAAQQRYARYMDTNQNIVLRSVRTEQERLQNEMTLAYSLYNQMAQQLQLSKAKVQESTPVFTAVQPATVPLTASSTSKLMTLIVFTFLGGIVCVGWILVGRGLVNLFKMEDSRR